MRKYSIPRNLVANKLDQAELAILFKFQKTHYYDQIFRQL
jgi:hypothetical protein